MSGVTLPSPGETRRPWISFRAARLRWPEWVVAASTLVLLVSLLGLSWFTFLRPSGGLGTKYYSASSEDGWHGLAHAHWLLLVTILLALCLLFFQATRPAPALPSTLSLFLMVLAGLCTIWLLVRVVIDPPGGRDFGGWLGLLSAAVLTWSAYKSVRMEGIAPEDGPQEIPTLSRQDLAHTQNPPPSEHS